MADLLRVSHELEPVYDRHSRVLILGSLPSVVSRKMQFYYANPTNRFWPLMEQLFEERITDRRTFCLSHHIALWDVIESCLIHGSDDSSIRDVIPNDIAGLVRKTAIHTVFMTGKKAFMLYEKYIDLDIKHVCLPSTSAANAAMRMDRLLKEYACVKEACRKN